MLQIPLTSLFLHAVILLKISLTCHDFCVEHCNLFLAHFFRAYWILHEKSLSILIESISPINSKEINDPIQMYPHKHIWTKNYFQLLTYFSSHLQIQVFSKNFPANLHNTRKQLLTVIILHILKITVSVFF